MPCCGRLQFPALVEGPSSSSLRISKLKIYINKNRELCITYVYISQYNTTRTRFPPFSRRRALCIVILDVPTYTVNKRNEPVTMLCAPGEEFAWRPVMVTSCCRRRGARSDTSRTRRYFTHPEAHPHGLHPQKNKTHFEGERQQFIHRAPVYVHQNIIYIYNYVYIRYVYYNICVYLYIYSRCTPEYANVYGWTNE